MDKTIFTGGLNFDDEDRILPAGDYRYALNCHIGISESGNTGTVTNVKGNTLITFPLPSGQNTCIGTFEDKKDNTVIYCVHNENGEHQILRYFPDTDTITSIINSSLLGFDTNYLITGMAFIEGKFFFWTDDNQEPGFLDFDGLDNGNYPTTLTEQHIRAIPYAPNFPPTAAYVNDQTRKTNNLKKSLFQFKYQYIYKDDRPSAWSPISKLPLPNTEYVYGSALPAEFDNGIDITLNTGDYIVKKINVAARMGNTGDFFLIDTLEKTKIASSLLLLSITDPDDQDYTFRFFNDGLYTSIEINESNKLFDFLPKKAKALSPIDGNRIAYGNGVDGFDPVEIDISLTPIIHPLSDLPTTGGANLSVTTTPTSIYAYNNAPPVVGEFYRLKFTLEFKYFSPLPPNGLTWWTMRTKEYNYSEACLVGDTMTTIFDRFKVQMDNDTTLSSALFVYTLDSNYSTTLYNPVSISSYMNGAISVLSVNSTQQNFTYRGTVFSNLFVTVSGGSLTTSSSNPLKRCFKSGATHEIGLIYYDTPNRSSTVQISPQSKVYVPFQSERGVKDGWVDMQVKIRHRPPARATHYQLAYTKNQNVASFVTVAESITVSGANTTMVLTNLLTFQTDNPGTLFDYDWAIGDRIRFIQNRSVNPISFMTTYVDLEIVEFNSSTSTITFQTNTNLTNGYGYLVEIYRPQKSITNKFYYEIGECYEIGDAGLSTAYHKGNTQDQDAFTLQTFTADVMPSNTANAQLSIQTSQNITAAQYSIGDPITISGTDYNGTFTITGMTYAAINGVTYIIEMVLDTPFTTQESSVSCSSTPPAIITTDNQGDVYFRKRGTIYAEDPSYSDFFVSNYCNIGRPSVYDAGAAEQRRIATIWYSQQFIPDTNINGLGSFFDTNFEEYNKNYDSIQYLIQQNSDLLIFQELKVGAIPINQSIFSDTQGQSVVSASLSVLSNVVRYYAGEYGIGVHPESFACYGNRKYFCDYQRGAVLRLSTDGITPISEYKAHSYFAEMFKDIMNASSKRNIYGAYDVKYGRYVLSLERKVINITTHGGQSTSTVSYERETIAFDEPSNRWKMFFSYQPEFMCGSNLDIVSFKDGDLYLHDDNDNRGEFFGVSYPMEITFLHNEMPVNTKVYNAMQTDSNEPFAVELTNQFGQETHLLTTDFEKIEGVYWAAFWKDENTPVQNPLFSGDDIRCYAATIKLSNDLSTFVKLFAVGIKTQISELTNR